MTKKRQQTSEKIALMEEALQVDTQEVTTGLVRVATHVETVEEVARADLTADTVEVLRKPINKPVEGQVPQMRTEGDLVIVPILEEVLVVEKRLMLKEEVHLRTKTTVKRIETPVTLRKEHADIERVSTDEPLRGT